MRHLDHLTPEVADFLSAGTRTGKLGDWGMNNAERFGKRNAVPGELLVRLEPTKVTAVFDVTG